MKTRPTKSLKPHPINQGIYGDEADESFIESIRFLGITHPLIINQNDVILSGHRRWAAACFLELETVPVEVRQTADDLEDRLILLHSNHQRRKTNEQMGREAAALMEVEGELAKRRRQATLKQNATVVEKFSQRSGDDSGRARDKVAEQLGVSGPTVDKVVAVVKKIDELQAKGKAKKAEAIQEKLNKKSIEAAYNLVKPKSPAKTKPKATTKAKEESKPTPEPEPEEPSPQTPEETPPEPEAAPAPKALPVTDELGIPLSGAMVEVFAIRQKFDAICALIAQLQKLIGDAAESPGASYYIKHLKGKMTDGKMRYSCEHQGNCRRKVKWAEPYSSVCPYCHHKGKGVDRACRACHGLGWVTKEIFTASPPEYQQAVKELKP